MAYMVLARKWRPKFFDSMVGQEHVAKTLQNAILFGKVGQGYLFTGTRGVGKTSAARILAKALNCEEISDKGEPCDSCENCKATDEGSALDVLEIDGASNRGVEDIRELREQVKYTPMKGKYKIYIIDEVHMLTKEAFNALLKTLEEPPRHVVFIFATTEIRKIPSTILSRVQRFDFKRITDQKLRDRLEYIGKQEGISMEEKALEVLARRANGSMRDALSLLDQIYAFSGNKITEATVQSVLGIPPDKTYEELLKAIEEHQKGRCFSLLENTLSLGVEVSEFLSGFGQFLRNVLFVRQVGLKPSDLGLSEERFTYLASLVPSLRDGDIIRYSKVVSDILSDLKQTQNSRLTVEMGLVRLASLDKVVDLNQLLRKPTGEDPMNSQDISNRIVEKKNSNFEKTLEDRTSKPKEEVFQEQESLEKVIKPNSNDFIAPNSSSKDSVQYMDSIPIEELEPTFVEDNLEEKITRVIPLLSETKEFVTHWNDLIHEFMESEMLIAGQFLETELDWNVESPYVLDVLFKKENAFQIVQSDSSGVRTLEGFLSHKLRDKKSIRLHPILKNIESRSSFQKAGEIAIDSNQGDDLSSMETSDKSVSQEKLFEKEPMIAYAMDLFQGDILQRE